jgi:enolase
LQKLLIKKILARKILDSRGNPTIEADVTVSAKGMTTMGRAAAPSGASRGKYEVADFPDGGVDAALKKIAKISAKLSGKNALDQENVDSLLHEIDGTPNFHNIGGNTAVAISLATAKAAATARGVPLFQYLNKNACELPRPLGNVIGGGKHAKGNTPDIQEFLVLPVGAKKLADAVFTNAKVHQRVRKLISADDETFTGGRGDEGALAPNLDNEKSLDIVAKACEEITAETGIEVRPCLDVAASSFYNDVDDTYVYRREGRTRDGGEQIDFIAGLIDTYKLPFVEDPLHEEDFEGFAELTKKVGDRCLICGDDLFVTNVERILKGIKKKSANSVLIKPNQIGTLTETVKAIALTKKSGYTPVISHRSGETTDDTIAHIAVGWGCPIIKTGAVGGERIAKLNELIRIEEALGKKAKMGKLPF